MPLSATVGGRSGVDVSGCFTSAPLLSGPRLLRAAGPLGAYLLGPDWGFPPCALPSADFSCDTRQVSPVVCFAAAMPSYFSMCAADSGLRRCIAQWSIHHGLSTPLILPNFTMAMIDSNSITPGASAETKVETHACVSLTSSSIALLCHFFAFCRCNFFPGAGWLSVFRAPCDAQPCLTPQYDRLSPQGRASSTAGICRGNERRATTTQGAY